MNRSQGNSAAAYEYFNNPLNQQVTNNSDSNDNINISPMEQLEPLSFSGLENNAAAGVKRTACTLCRRRKLRCDGTKPSCATCSRLSHDCRYDEARKKSGPKRGYVKVLEARLAQVESLLKTQGTVDGNEVDVTESAMEFAFVDHSHVQNNAIAAGQQPAGIAMLPKFQSSQVRAVGQEDDEGLLETLGQKSSRNEPFGLDPFAQDIFASDSFSWDLIALGLEEALPPVDVMDDLYAIYFSKCHNSQPLLHQGRFFAAMNLSPQMRPPVCLRYAMWAHAAAASDKYNDLKDTLYRRSRKYLEIDELRGLGEAMVTLAYCQAWILCGTFEFQHMHFPRAWLSTGRAIRLAQMLGLERLDCRRLDVKEPLAASQDWLEKEERRRAFWASYWSDRCASIGTGWPMTIDERDIKTNLPASEEAFQTGREEITPSLAEALNYQNMTNLSAYAMSMVCACLFGRNLAHVHRPTPDDRPGDLNGQFWIRHRKIDSILSNISLHLPDHLRLDTLNPEPIIVFLNMCIHTSSICLHHPAMEKADNHQLPDHISTESKVRCFVAAGQIATIMRTVCHMDFSSMNPFMAFCLYVSGRVLVGYLRTRPDDQQCTSSVHFLLSAMHAFKKKNPLSQTFLAQLELDMEVAGLRNPYAHQSAREALKKIFPMHVKRHGSGCPSVFTGIDVPEGLSNQDDLRSLNQKSFPSGGPTPSSSTRQASSSIYANASVGTTAIVDSAHEQRARSGVTELSPSGTNEGAQSSDPSVRDSDGSSRNSFSTPHSEKMDQTPGSASQNPFVHDIPYDFFEKPPPQESSAQRQQTMEMPLHSTTFTPTPLQDDFCDFDNAMFVQTDGGGGGATEIEGGSTPFGVSMNWEQAGTGTGMTPASGDQWAQMMESIGEWDGNAAL